DRHIELNKTVELSQAKEKFCAYLRSLPRRSILLIDNAAEWQMIEDIVLWSHRTIITTEEDFIPSDIEHILIRVDPPSTSVAESIVRWFRPTAEPASIHRFITAVGRRPRIMLDILFMFPETSMSLDEMSECIQDEAARLLETAGKSSRAVHKLYGKYFEKTETERPTAAACVAMLS